MTQQAVVTGVLALVLLAAAPGPARAQLENYDNYSIPASPPIEWGALIVAATVPAEQQIMWRSREALAFAPHGYQSLYPGNGWPVAYLAEPNMHLFHVFALQGTPEAGLKDGDRIMVGIAQQPGPSYLCEAPTTMGSEHQLAETDYNPHLCVLRIETVEPGQKVTIGGKPDDGTRFRLAVTSRRSADFVDLPDMYLVTSSGKLTLQEARQGAAEFTFTRFEEIPTKPWRRWDSGEVVIVTDDNQWVLQTRWQDTYVEPATRRAAVQRAPQWPGGMGLLAQFIQNNRFKLHGYSQSNPPTIDPKAPAFLRVTEIGTEEFEWLCGSLAHTRADQVPEFDTLGCYWFIEPVNGEQVQLGTVSGGGGTPVRIGWNSTTVGAGGLRYLSVHANSGGQDWRAAGLAGDATTFRILRNDTED